MPTPVTEIASFIKDVVVILAAITASCVGILGLSAWRRQLDGNTKYQLAKNILTCVYELRDRIDWLRTPLKIRPAEPDLPEEKVKNLDGAEKDWHALVQAYQKEWEPIVSTTAKLEAHLWEAEAVFGWKVVAGVRKLKGKVSDLSWAVQERLEARNPANRLAHQTTEEDEEDRKDRVGRMRILHKGRQDDQFGGEIDAIIAAIAADLRQHIRGFSS